jgi:hypothetical protein
MARAEPKWPRITRNGPSGGMEAVEWGSPFRYFRRAGRAEMVVSCGWSEADQGN